MLFSKFLIIISIALCLTGTIYTVSGIVGMSTKAIAQVSTPKWGYNQTMIEGFSRQKAETIVGVGLIVFGGIIQIFSLFLPNGEVDAFKSNFQAILLLAPLLFSIFFVAYMIKINLSETFLFESKKELVVLPIENWKDGDKTKKHTILKRAKDLFSLEQTESESFESFVERLEKHISS